MTFTAAVNRTRLRRLGALALVGLAGVLVQLATPATSAARAHSCGAIQVPTNPAQRMNVKIVRGSVSCRTAKLIIRGSVQPGPLAGWACDDYPGERPARITCSGSSSVDGSSGTFRAVRTTSPSRPGAAKSRYCGRVTFGTPDGPAMFDVHLRVRGVSCGRAERIAESTVFGQGAPPPHGWRCGETSSVRGRCSKGARRLVYAASRTRIPRL